MWYGTLNHRRKPRRHVPNRTSPKTLAHIGPERIMQQIKLFVGTESEVRTLEDNANEWLRENDVDVINMFGNIAPQTMSHIVTQTENAGRRFQPSDLFLAIVYNTK